MHMDADFPILKSLSRTHNCHDVYEKKHWRHCCMVGVVTACIAAVDVHLTVW